MLRQGASGSWKILKAEFLSCESQCLQMLAPQVLLYPLRSTLKATN